jgi:hypothetical protein
MFTKDGKTITAYFQAKSFSTNKNPEAVGTSGFTILL